jgi:hypothetical protein
MTEVVTISLLFLDTTFLAIISTSLLLSLVPMNLLFGTEAAEERFKEVGKSYEAIKLERKNG